MDQVAILIRRYQWPALERPQQSTRRKTDQRASEPEHSDLNFPMFRLRRTVTNRPIAIGPYGRTHHRMQGQNRLIDLLTKHPEPNQSPKPDRTKPLLTIRLR